MRNSLLLLLLLGAAKNTHSAHQEAKGPDIASTSGDSGRSGSFIEIVPQDQVEMAENERLHSDYAQWKLRQNELLRERHRWREQLKKYWHKEWEQALARLKELERRGGKVPWHKGIIRSRGKGTTPGEQRKSKGVEAAEKQVAHFREIMTKLDEQQAPENIFADWECEQLELIVRRQRAKLHRSGLRVARLDRVLAKARARNKELLQKWVLVLDRCSEWAMDERVEAINGYIRWLGLFGGKRRIEHRLDGDVLVREFTDQFADIQRDNDGKLMSLSAAEVHRKFEEMSRQSDGSPAQGNLTPLLGRMHTVIAMNGAHENSSKLLDKRQLLDLVRGEMFTLRFGEDLLQGSSPPPVGAVREAKQKLVALFKRALDKGLLPLERATAKALLEIFAVRPLFTNWSWSQALGIVAERYKMFHRDPSEEHIVGLGGKKRGWALGGRKKQREQRAKKERETARSMDLALQNEKNVKLGKRWNRLYKRLQMAGKVQDEKMPKRDDGSLKQLSGVVPLTLKKMPSGGGKAKIDWERSEAYKLNGHILWLWEGQQRPDGSPRKVYTSGAHEFLETFTEKYAQIVGNTAIQEGTISEQSEQYAGLKGLLLARGASLRAVQGEVAACRNRLKGEWERALGELKRAKTRLEAAKRSGEAKRYTEQLDKAIGAVGKEHLERQQKAANDLRHLTPIPEETEHNQSGHVDSQPKIPLPETKKLVPNFYYEFGTSVHEKRRILMGRNLEEQLWHVQSHLKGLAEKTMHLSCELFGAPKRRSDENLAKWKRLLESGAEWDRVVAQNWLEMAHKNLLALVSGGNLIDVPTANGLRYYIESGEELREYTLADMLRENGLTQNALGEVETGILERVWSLGP